MYVIFKWSKNTKLLIAARRKRGVIDSNLAAVEGVQTNGDGGRLGWKLTGWVDLLITAYKLVLYMHILKYTYTQQLKSQNKKP